MYYYLDFLFNNIISLKMILMNSNKVINDKLYREIADELGISYSQVKDVIICQFSFVRNMMEKKIENAVILPRIGKIAFNKERAKKLNEISNKINNNER